MSRGPGKWQRAVIEAAEAAIDPETGFTRGVTIAEAFAKCRGDNLPPHLDEPARESIRRAMHTLAKAGKVELAKDWGEEDWYGNVRDVLTARLPAGPAQRAQEAARREAAYRGAADFARALKGDR